MRHTSHHEATWGAAIDAPYIRRSTAIGASVRNKNKSFSLVIAAGEAQRQLLSSQIPRRPCRPSKCTNSYTPQGIRNPLFAESASFGPSEAESQSGGGDLAVAVKRDW